MKKIILSLAVVLLVGCGIPADIPPDRPIHNVIVPLDLSDRVLVSGQLGRDLDALDAVIEWFEQSASPNDRLTFQPIPQSSFPGATSYLSQLQVDLVEIPLREIASELPRRSQNLQTELHRLYREAVDLEEHSGADTWGYLRDLYLPATTAAGDSVRYSVILPTDGYIVAANSRFEVGDQATFIPMEVLEQARSCQDTSHAFRLMPVRDDDLSHLSVLMLEVRPRVSNLCEFETLKSISARWFEEMGVGYYEIHRSTDDNHARRDIITRFLDRQQEGRRHE